MPELFRTRCKQGTLVVTDTYIRTELPGTIQQHTLYRANLIGIDSTMGVPSIFGLGGGTNLVFHGQGAQILQADLVPSKVAKQIIAALQPS